MKDSDREMLETIKKNVDISYNYFSDNYKNFYKSKEFIYKTALSAEDLSTLEELGKPQIEFNTIEAYISRLIGEFSTQEPSVKVSINDTVPVDEITPDLIAQQKVIEAHCRHILRGSGNDNLQVSVYEDQLGGGFGAMRVYTDYISEKSFKQKIYLDRPFDPTLVGFDPLARESHKGDGSYCFEASPYTKEDFEAEFGKEKLDGISFTKGATAGNFNWSYKDKKREILLVVDYFVKVKKRRTLVELADGSVGYEYLYNKKLKEYEQSVEMAVPPVVVDRRQSYEEIIKVYRVCENKIIEVNDTDYKFLPIIFVDGNSVMLREGSTGDSYQFTRCYTYHATGNQKLRNFAGQTLGQQMENLLQHKIVVPKEAIPTEYKEAYQNIQTASTLVYNQFLDEDVNVRLDPPRELQQANIPTFVQEVFSGADRTTQSILGNYDAVLGIGQKDLSGKAIEAGALQSSFASDPYLINYIRALNRALEIIADLMPKYYKKPGSIPVMDEEGEEMSQLINMEQGEMEDGLQSVNLDYDSDHFEINVTAGVNTQVQKQASLETLVRLMSSSEVFAAFINKKGLPIIVDNLDIRSADQLKLLAKEFMEEMAQAEEEAKQQPQEDPAIAEAEAYKQVEAVKAQQQQIDSQSKLAIGTADLAIKKQKADTEQIKVLADIESNQVDDAIKIAKVDAEQARDTVELLKSVAEDVTSQSLDINRITTGGEPY